MIYRGDLIPGMLADRDRAYLIDAFGALLKTGAYDRVVIPQCGRMAGAEAAVAAGWPTDRVEVSDATLFSAVVGAAVAGERVGRLNVTLASGVWPEGLDLSDPPTVLYAIKLANLRYRHVAKKFGQNYLYKQMIRDLERRPADHVRSLLQCLSGLRDKLRGVKYQTRDAHEHLIASAADPRAVVWLGPIPPFKLVTTDGAVAWSGPAVPSYKATRDAARMAVEGAASAALILRFRPEKVDPGEVPVFAVDRDKTRTDFIVCNRPTDMDALMDRKGVGFKAMQMFGLGEPVLPCEYEIRPDSKVWFRPVCRQVALYYRDLFMHRLGGSGAELFRVLMVDGYVAGICGVMDNSARLGNETIDDKIWLYDTYGFTAPSTRHVRLNRLLRMLMVTRSFVEGAVEKFADKPVGLATTCLCEQPENMVMRNIMKVVKRERLPSGLWRLQLVAKAKDRTNEDVLAEWLKKHGHHRKPVDSPEPAAAAGGADDGEGG